MASHRVPDRKGTRPQAQLRRLILAADAREPLPPTRELGERLGLAHTTVFRLLQRLAGTGDLWQHPVNGRYYPAAARAHLDRPKPVACLTRRLELASALYREILEGISLGCGEGRRTMLLWHDELLVNHPDPHSPPVFAAVEPQRAILADFLERHGEAAGGFVLDHVWADDALRAHAGRLQPAVVLFRECALPGFGNVRADFHAGALKALAHLLGRGFDTIVPVRPFSGDPAVEQFLAALDTAVDELGDRARLAAPVAAGTERQRSALIAGLKQSRGRSALLCPEDNVAVLLQQAAVQAQLACPGHVGIFSAMGTQVARDAGITALHFDFRELGRRAVQALGESPAGRHSLAPRLQLAATT